eukprot:CCRYP_013193-RA/>CCRYP_013193-RA protein AED:0.40 eAED:0.40 QI:0/-1/0/1/-1/1/1/0/122
MSIYRISIVFVTIVLIEFAVAFAPAAIPTSYKPSALSLVPEQGRQLVAYSQSVLAKKAKESASKASNLTSGRRRNDATSEGGLVKARNLMTRLLNISPRNEGVNRHLDEESSCYACPDGEGH